MQQPKNNGLKNLEIFFWLLIPIALIVYSVSKFGAQYFFANPEVIAQFFYAAFPVFFAVMSKLVYDDYPIAAIINSIKNKKTKNNDE